MHSRLPSQVNKAIVDLALEMKEYVCAIDIAGGDSYYQTRLEEFAGLYSYAREEGLNTTGHLYETKDGCYPQLLPYLQRIGHGIQIPRPSSSMFRSLSHHLFKNWHPRKFIAIKDSL